MIALLNAGGQGTATFLQVQTSGGIDYKCGAMNGNNQRHQVSPQFGKLAMNLSLRIYRIYGTSRYAAFSDQPKHDKHECSSLW